MDVLAAVLEAEAAAGLDHEVEPGGRGGVVAGPRLGEAGAGDEAEVGHGHDPAARVAAGAREAAELEEAHVAQGRLLFQLARGGLGDRLAGLDEAAGERPRALEGLSGPLDEEDGEPPRLAERDHHDVGGEARAGVLFLLLAHRMISAAVETRTPAAAISSSAPRVPSGVMPAIPFSSSVTR